MELRDFVVADQRLRKLKKKVTTMDRAPTYRVHPAIIVCAFVFGWVGFSLIKHLLNF